MKKKYNKSTYFLGEFVRDGLNKKDARWQIGIWPRIIDGIRPGIGRTMKFGKVDEHYGNVGTVCQTKSQTGSDHQYKIVPFVPFGDGWAKP